MGLLIFFASVAYGASGGTISGTVKDPDGAPLKGTFVRARSAAKSKITISVLSDKQGHYRMENLGPGSYEVWATAVGYNNNPPAAVNVAAGQSASFDFALQRGMVRWSDLTVYQGEKLLPEGKGKEVLFGQCYICHGFQTRMAEMRWDEAGWVRAVNFMRQAMHSRLAGLSDQDAASVASYLNTVFGADSKLPKSPAELPGYKETVRPVSDQATKITYVDYDLPGPNRMPFSGAPDKNGKIWIPDFGKANRIARLDPASGEVQEFVVPNQGTAGIHSAWPAPDGTVWLTEQASNKLGKWDPTTGKITEYQDAYQPGKEGLEAGGSKHTVRVDFKGYVWSSGSPLTRLDPKTGKFTRFPEVPSAYDVNLDKEGNVWFTVYRDSKIGKVDAKTGKLTLWDLPTKGNPRRLVVDSQGIAWAGEFTAGKIARFDPKTETFKEYQLPGPSPTPYAMGIDRDDNIWYSSHDMDVVGRLDPKTGEVTEYPIPYSENYMKEFFLDSQGRMWWGSPPNNKVGYFTLPDGNSGR
jgi:virginiamycin B lyase